MTGVKLRAGQSKPARSTIRAAVAPPPDLMNPTDTLTGLFDRAELVEDLARAVVPNAPPSRLVVFELLGLEVLLDVLPREDGEFLLVRLAARLKSALGSGPCYLSRRAEFCCLLSLAQAETTLERAKLALSAAARPYLLTISYTVVHLPDEARDPVEALERADTQLLKLTRTEERRRKRDRTAGVAA